MMRLSLRMALAGLALVSTVIALAVGLAEPVEWRAFVERHDAAAARLAEPVREAAAQRVRVDTADEVPAGIERAQAAFRATDVRRAGRGVERLAGPSEACHLLRSCAEAIRLRISPYGFGMPRRRSYAQVPVSGDEAVLPLWRWSEGCEPDHVGSLANLLRRMDRTLPTCAELLERAYVGLGRQLRERAAAGESKRALAAVAGELDALIDETREVQELPWDHAVARYQAFARLHPVGDPGITAEDAMLIAGELRQVRLSIRLLYAAALTRLHVTPSAGDWPVDPFTLRPIEQRADVSVGFVWAGERMLVVPR
jgi:hypothetical protein